MKERKKLTEKESAVLEALSRHADKRTSLVEISNEIGFKTKQNIEGYITRLVAKGYLKRKKPRIKDKFKII